VVHVAVRKKNVVYGNNLVGGLADVETDIQLRHRNDGLFACDRIADYFQIIYLYAC
jgi:hypothetical protein